MNVPDVVTALAEHWDDVIGRLAEPDRRLLRDQVATLTSGADEDARTEALLVVVDLLLPVLPDGHPVERALSDGNRSVGAVADPELLPALDLLRMRLLSAAPEPPPDPESPAQAWAGARRRLLAAPSVSARELALRGGDPDRPGLIRLDGDDGTLRLPAFQFDRAGDPVPVVLRVNRILDAEDDPWGVADWWLCPHAWLGAAPADLLAVTAAAVLVEVALGETEDRDA